MANIILKQPNNKYAIYSTIVDAFSLFNADKKDIVEFYQERYGSNSINSVKNTLERMEKYPLRDIEIWNEKIKLSKHIHGSLDFELENGEIIKEEEFLLITSTNN